MKKMSLLLILIILLVNSIFAAGIDWYDMKTGLEKAQRFNKPVIIKFYTDWCGWCTKMDKSTFSDQKVIDIMNRNFICIKYNPETDGNVLYKNKSHTPQEIKNTLRVSGYPSTVFLSEGKLDRVSSISGYRSSDDFLSILDFMNNKLYGKMDVDQYVGFSRYIKYEQRNPGNPDINFVIGFFYQYEMKNLAEAKKHFNNVIKADPNYAEAYLCLRDIAKYEGRTNEANDWDSKAKRAGYDPKITITDKLNEAVRKTSSLL